VTRPNTCGTDDNCATAAESGRDMTWSSPRPCALVRRWVSARMGDQHHVSAEDTFEQIRQTSRRGGGSRSPTGRSYSPRHRVGRAHDASAGDEASAAHRLGQEVREHVIDPIAKQT
jgi:hypothetical protein